MTVAECYERAVSFIPEVPEDNVDMQKHAVTWANVLLVDSLNAENVFRRVNKIPELDSAPKVLSEEEEIPYNERLVAAAFPYGMARWIFRENDDVSGSHEYYQLYATAILEATPLEVVEITDVYR